MTRIVAMSDTHLLHNEVRVPDGDVLIHAGDALIRGGQEELGEFAKWWRGLPHETKLFVPGNHDKIFQNEWATAVEMMAGTEIIEHGRTTLAGVKTFASSWTPGGYPGVHRWAFHYPVQSPNTMWQNAGDPHTKLFVTHGPGLGIGDATSAKFGNANVGCPHLTARLMELAMFGDLEHHIFGHIHDGHGLYQLNLEQTKHKTMLFHNVAICDDYYKVGWEPTVIDL